MTFILKTTERGSIASPVAADSEHSLYADIVSVHFRREEGGAATAHVWMREPVKTAEVPGFVEVEKFISFTGSAYVMNEAGKTVSSFAARTSGDPDRDDNVRRKEMRAVFAEFAETVAPPPARPLAA